MSLRFFTLASVLVVASLTPAWAQDEVRLNVTQTTIAENGGSSEVSATLVDNAGTLVVATDDVTVTLDFSNSTATQTTGVPADDFSVSGTTLTIPAGSSTSTGSVTITADDDDENDAAETIVVDATAEAATTPTPTAVPVQNSPQITITDDDRAEVIGLSISAASLNENGGVATIEVDLDSPAEGNVSIPILLPNDLFFQAGGSAIQVLDGQTSGSATIQTRNNSVDDGDRTVTVSVAANGFQGDVEDADNAPTSDTVVILDDELTFVTLSRSSSTVPEEGPGRVTLTATLTSRASGNVTVYLSTSNPDDVTVTDQFSGSRNRITIRSGQTSGSATLEAVDDLLAEEDEPVTVQITSVSGRGVGGTGITRANDPARIGNPRTVTVTVIDDIDVNIQVSAVQQVVSEDAGTAEVVIEVTDQPDVPYEIVVTLVSGDPADLGGFTSAALNFGGPNDDGEDERYVVSVPITDDLRPESAETFVFRVHVQTDDASAQTVTLLGAETTALVVVDNDGEAVAATVPADGLALFAVPVNGLTAADVAAAAGADAVFVLDGAEFVVADAGSILSAGQAVLVEPAGDLTLSGSAAPASVAAATTVVPAVPGDRVLAVVGNPSSDAVSFADVTVEGGTVADVVLLFDAASGAFRPVSLAGLGVELSDLTLGPFEVVVLNVVPDGGAADVSVSLSPSGAASGGRLSDTDFVPTSEEAAVVLELRPASDAGRLADAPGDVVVLRFGIGSDGLDAFDGADVVSPLGATFAAVGPSDGGALLAALSAGAVTRAQPVTVPLSVSVPAAGDYEIALVSMPGDIDGRPVQVEILDGTTATTVSAGGSVAFSATEADITDGLARFSVRVSLGVGVSSEADGPEALALSVYPNPTAGAATVALAVPSAEPVRVSVFDALGREVAVVHDGPAVGDVRAVVDGLAPGAYVIRAVAAGAVSTRPLVVTR